MVGTGEYQQVYSNDLFNGPITITGLQFYNTQEDSFATAMNTGTFTISLSTTIADWNTLNSIPANNIGGNDTQVFSGSLFQPWSFGDTLSIAFTTPFIYTPGPGANLLMDVVATGTGTPGGFISFDTNGNNGNRLNGDTFFGRYYGLGNIDSGYGLVTGFEIGSSGTPEPGALWLLTAGLIGVAVFRLRRNPTVV